MALWAIAGDFALDRRMIVKNAYKIFNASGGLLCVQIAHSAVEAVDFAKMYGFNDAFRAEQV
jgi:hypothetical protein